MWGHVRLRRDTSPSRHLKSPIGGQCSNLSTKRRNRVALGSGTTPIGGNFILDPYSLIFAVKPIPRRLGSGSFIRLRIAYNPPLNCRSYLFSNATSLCAKSWCVETACRRQINALMISMFTWTARSLVRTEDSMAIPCSVKTYGAYFRCFPRPVFKAPDWLLKEADSSTPSWNMKSAGKRPGLHRTAG